MISQTIKHPDGQLRSLLYLHTSLGTQPFLEYWLGYPALAGILAWEPSLTWNTTLGTQPWLEYYLGNPALPGTLSL